MPGLRVTPYKLVDSVEKVNLSLSKSYIEIPWLFSLTLVITLLHIYLREGMELMFDLEHRQQSCLNNTV